jgi:FkbM family methyltransferase
MGVFSRDYSADCKKPDEKAIEMTREVKAVTFLSRHCQPDTVVVVGIGLGREVPEMRKTWPNARLIGVEPVRDNYNYLNESGIASAFDDIYNVAIWSRVMILSMLHNEQTVSARSAIAALYNVTTTCSVSAVTLDRLEQMTGKWNGDTLLWIDAEGSELHIVKGMTQRPRWCSIELSWIPDAGCPSARKVETYMNRLGYSLGYIHSISRKHAFGDGLFLRKREWRRLCRQSRFRKLNRYTWHE